MRALSRIAAALGLIGLMWTLQACSALSGDFSSAPAGSVLFQDDFSDPGSGWSEIASEERLAAYEDGAYHLAVNIPAALVLAHPNLAFTDVQVEVDAIQASGPDNNQFGVLCRFEDAENYYFFIISSDGYYGIGKVVAGEPELIGHNAMPPSEAIRQGRVVNHLRADCAGESLRLYVNGELIDSQQDATLTAGDVGLFAGTYDQPGTGIFFDNLSVLKPEAP